MENTCRTCLANEFVVETITSNDFVEKIKTIADVEISATDLLPQKICTLCAHTINNYSKFKQKILESDKFLRENINIKYEAQIDEFEDNITADISIDDTDIDDDEGDELFGGIPSVEEEPFSNKSSALSKNTPNRSLDGKNDEHVVSKEGKGSYKCLKCNFTATQIKAAQRHESEFSPRLFCPMCNRWVKKSYLRRHIKEVHRKDDLNGTYSKILNGTFQEQKSYENESDTLDFEENNTKNHSVPARNEIKENEVYIKDDTQLSSDEFVQGVPPENPTENIIEHHVEKDLQSKMYKCLQCDFVTNTNKKANKHRAMYAPRVNCPLCCSLIKKTYLKDHIRTRHPMDFETYEENKGVKKEVSNINSDHMSDEDLEDITKSSQENDSANEQEVNPPTSSKLVHTVEKDPITNLYKCSTCDFESSIYEEAKSHKKLQALKVNCPVCHIFINKTYIKEHLRCYHPDNNEALIEVGKVLPEVTVPVTKQPLVCNLCNFIATTRRKYLDHRRTHQSKMYCSICQTYMSKTQYLRHKPDHGSEIVIDGVNYFLCRRCDYKTTDEEDLKEHKKTHVNRIVCSICGDSVTAYNIQGHLFMHKGKTVECSICSKVVKATSYRKHMEMHTEEENTCKICGETFTIKSKYSFHMAKHQKKSTFNCQLCDREFKEKAYLNRHMRSHTGERPYPCKLCGKRLSNRNALKGHIRLHTKEKPFTCNMCPLAFTQRVSLRTHMRSKHNVELPSTVMFTKK